MRERAHDVVLRCAAAILDDFRERDPQALGRVHRAPLVDARTDEVDREVVQRLELVGRQPEHARDDRERDGERQLGDEVGPAVPADDLVDGRVDDRCDDVGLPAGDRGLRERLHDERTVRLVLRAVHLEDRAAHDGIE